MITINIKQRKSFTNLAADKYYRVVFVLDEETGNIFLVRYNLFGRKMSNICPIYSTSGNFPRQNATFTSKHLAPRTDWPDVQEFFDQIGFQKVNYLSNGQQYMAYKDQETGLYYIIKTFNIVVR